MNWFRSTKELPTREPSTGDQFLGSFYSDPDTGEIFRTLNESSMEKEKEQFQISVNPNKEGVLTILHGKAQDPDPRPKALNISGTLTAPYNYYAGRKEALDAMKHLCRLEVSHHQQTIKLFVDDKSGVASDVITGTLTNDRNLDEWAINTAERYTVREFVNYIRQRKYMFAQNSQASQLIAELLTWHVKIEKEVKEFNDNRGNSLSSFETRISQIKLMDSFQLNVPIFTGYEKVLFTVEIGVEPVSNGVQLFLISDQLAEMKPELVDKYINDELAKFEGAGFNCSRIFV